MPDSPAETPMPEAPAKPELKLERLKVIEIPTTAHAMDLEPDGRRAYVACFDGSVLAVDPESGEITPFTSHDSYASGVKRVPGTNLLVSSGYDGAILWHDLETRELVRRVQAHSFWSWDLAASPDGKYVASVTGQYLAGGYKYEPAPSEEATVKLFDACTGELKREWNFLPPVQAARFSPDGKHLAAGNLMGDLRVWDVESGEQLAEWNTPDMTTWGVSKSPHYISGVQDVCFSPDGAHVLASGIASMFDPIAVNGKQMWQRFDWRENPVKKVDEVHEKESSTGIIESLAFHPSGEWFLMAGRLVFGKFSVSAFDSTTGDQMTAVNVENFRVTEAMFTADGERIFFAGGHPQEKKKDGVVASYGRLMIYQPTHKTA